jgi:hypothetical protein
VAFLLLHSFTIGPGGESFRRLFTPRRCKMKTGMIVYVTEGKEDVPLQESWELNRASRSLGVSAVCVATSEDELAYGWWHLITRGMHQVSCVAAAYDSVRDAFEPHGMRLRLWG